MGRTSRTSVRDEPHPELWKRVVWVGLLSAWAFAAASMLGFDPADPPTHTVWTEPGPVSNWCGPVGAHVAYRAYKLLGLGAWAVIACGALWFWLTATGRRIDHLGVRVLGVLLLVAALSGFQALAIPGTGPIADLPGGLIGYVGVSELAMRFSTVGTLLWIGLAAMIGATVAFDKYVYIVPVWAYRRMVPAARHAGAGAGSAAKLTGGLLGGLARKHKTIRLRMNDLDEPCEVRVVEDASPQPARPRRVPAATITAAPREPAREPDEELPGAPQVFTQEQLREKIAKLPVRFAGTERKLATEDDLRDLQNVAELKGYKFPPLDLLEEPEANFNEKLESMVREQAEALEAALRQYRIQGEVVGIESGPVITLYDVRLAPGTKVAQLSAVSSDVARALKAVNIRIVPNQLGRDTVGVEVPNPDKEKVRLRELMSSPERYNKMKLPMFLGKDASGNVLIADLAQMPHMLIAGTTGSGKSVLMNTIIIGFLYTKKPNELKLCLVDPKMVEMSQFKDIPHLMCPVVTEMSKAAAILEWAMGKMDERYEVLAEAGVRDIAAYNSLEWEELKERMGVGSDEEAARIPRKLPYMVFIIDELADLMMTTREVEGSIVRLAQKARAVGIHLILATQRPQANVVTGLIKSNMPCRVCFKVSSGMDSRIVTDQKGGELLLGQGDMLFLSPRTHKLQRAQGTLVDDAEIRRVVRFMRDVAAPSFERQLMQLRSLSTDEERLIESQNNSSASLAAAQEDPLFDRAVEIVLETSRGSVSLLQRRLAIGYTRASRLIDLMGIAGIIGEHKGSVAREVLITPEVWQEMKKLAGEELAAGAPGHGEDQGMLFAGAPPEVLETGSEPGAEEDLATRSGAEGSDASDATDEDDGEWEYVEVYEDDEEDDEEDQEEGEEEDEEGEDWEYEDDDEVEDEGENDAEGEETEEEPDGDEWEAEMDGETKQWAAAGDEEARD